MKLDDDVQERVKSAGDDGGRRQHHRDKFAGRQLSIKNLLHRSPLYDSIIAGVACELQEAIWRD